MDKEKVNEMIKYPQVRLILEDGKQMGLISSIEALRIAKEKGFDLVEISPNANPPVCKIMDYSKFKFEKNKKEKEARKKQKQHQIEIKEIKFRPKIDEHDYTVKLKHIKRFLEEGNKVKLTVRFRGREVAYQDVGLKLLKRVVDDLQDLCIIEKDTLLFGKQQIMVLGPKVSIKKE